MATDSTLIGSKSPGQSHNGPSGFMTIGPATFVVDHGTVFGESSPVALLWDDGLIQSLAPPFDFQGQKTIEELGATFKGIDAQGVVFEVPGTGAGPIGLLKYNGRQLTVLHGRISTSDHRVVGIMKDDGSISLRDFKEPKILHAMDEKTQLHTIFQGIQSNGKPLLFEWLRGLHKNDRTYADNEIMRYLPEDWDKFNAVQKDYVLETMKMWAASGILQVVRRSEGDAGLGNVKHGASGVTGVRTGKVLLDREEFETEIKLYKQFGPVAKIQTRIRPYSEVRINLVVSHEFGHQLEFTLSQSCQDRIDELYRKRLEHCNRIHPLPEGYDGGSELLLNEQIDQRVFISGYSRASMHEYWAECVAAFSVKDSRDMLRAMDPEIYSILQEVLFSPETTLSPKHEDDIIKLQTSLRIGGELSDDMLLK